MTDRTLSETYDLTYARGNGKTEELDRKIKTEL